MIKLTNIKPTDKIKQLRGQINAMQNEIMANQPFVGALVNPSINYYMFDEGNYKLIATNTATEVKSSLTALCFPEGNGVFVAGVWGRIMAEPHYVGSDTEYSKAVISVPAIKLATMSTNISTFVSCNSLGLPSLDPIQGLTTKPLQANIVDIRLYESKTYSIMTDTFIEQGDNICNIILSIRFS